MRLAVLAQFGITGILGSSALLFAFPAPEGVSKAPPAAIAVVMLSDLHFDPFHDPAKAPELARAGVEDWDRILSAPDSASQPADFAAVQKACKAKQFTDSPYALLDGALQAARKLTPNAGFVTVSGDLLVHDFDCRYRAALKLPPAAGDDESLSAAFAEKTTVYVMKKVERTFPRVPVYIALGNNDSRCNHNRLDVHDAYLRATGDEVVSGLVGVSAPERQTALSTYDGAGYYAVTMPAPMQRTRLLVVDDIYMMSKFSTCEADTNDHRGADEQIAWLNRELDAARQNGQQVWVLGHLPPSPNPRTSIQKNGICSGGEAEMYLSSTALADSLASHADRVRLGIFGHTHMDELHVVEVQGAGVPLKIVGSVSPVSGNRPSFTVGQVDPATATLMDYAVYEASNFTGTAAEWTLEYDFDKTYGEPSFTAKSLEDLAGRLHADSAGTSPESRAYMSHYFKGQTESELTPYWPAYACSLDHSTPASFKACACEAK